VLDEEGLERDLRGGAALAGVLLSGGVPTAKPVWSLLVRVATSGRTERSAASRSGSSGRGSSERRPGETSALRGAKLGLLMTEALGSLE